MWEAYERLYKDVNDLLDGLVDRFNNWSDAKARGVLLDVIDELSNITERYYMINENDKIVFDDDDD